MKESNNIDTVAAIFRMYIRRNKNKITPSDPQFADIGITCIEIERNYKSKYPASTNELKRIQAGVMAGLEGNVSKAARVIAGTVIRHLSNRTSKFIIPLEQETTLKQPPKQEKDC